MAVDEKIQKIEKITKDLENEKNFDVIVERFAEAAGLIKEVLSESAKVKGRVMEIVRDLDGAIEKAMDEDEQ
jgi:exonuclease VII small subunit